MRKRKVISLNLTWALLLSAPVFIYGLFIHRYSPKNVFAILSLAALLYLLVALSHHLKDRTLTLEVWVEYLLIAALALVIIQGLLF